MDLLQDLNTSVEEKLLLLCARLDPDEGNRQELSRLLEHPVRWGPLLYQAGWHQLSALLFHHISRLNDQSRVPSEVVADLRDAYRLNSARNLYHQAELQRVVRLLNEQDIPSIALKGAALLGSVYPDIGRRPMSDLDILVPYGKADSAFELIQTLGYAPAYGRYIQASMRARDRQLVALVAPGKPTTVEIHTHVVAIDSPLRFEITGFWERAREARVGKARFLVLSPEDLLTHLAVNFIRDRNTYSYSALRQLCDIAETARLYANSMDWEPLSTRVLNAGLGGPVFCSLYLSQRLLDAPIPDEVIQRLRPNDFGERQIVPFVKRRVLGYWVSSPKILSSRPQQWWKIPGTILKRVFPARGYLSARYNFPEQSKQVNYQYLRRLARALSTAVGLAAHPHRTYQDIKVDRWVHHLCESPRIGPD